MKKKLKIENLSEKFLLSTRPRLGGKMKKHRETDRFFAASGVERAQHNQDQFRFRRAAFYDQLKSKVSNILAKATTLCIKP